MKRIAIQGIGGSYHDTAARRYGAERFGPETVEVISCVSFRDVVRRVRDAQADYGMLAVENSVAGCLLHNYELIRENGLRIDGEYELRIAHCLAALPGTGLDAVTEIASHPMALMQCSAFLDTLPPAIRAVEADDTASAARRVAENRLTHRAVIGARKAAEIYGLEILAEGIENDRHNRTRFLFLAGADAPDAEEAGTAENKASLVFSLPHTVGSLSGILAVFSVYGLNLTTIQSFPIVGEDWRYSFYVDLTFEDERRYRQALAAATPLTEHIRVLGEYRAAGRTPAPR